MRSWATDSGRRQDASLLLLYAIAAHRHYQPATISDYDSLPSTGTPCPQLRARGGRSGRLLRSAGHEPAPPARCQQSGTPAVGVPPGVPAVMQQDACAPGLVSWTHAAARPPPRGPPLSGLPGEMATTCDALGVP